VKTFGAVNIEVLAHLLNSAAAVHVTLEVAADPPEGFDDSTLRVVAENARTLKFDVRRSLFQLTTPVRGPKQKPREPVAVPE
jgi:hypothetical protein